MSAEEFTVTNVSDSSAMVEKAYKLNKPMLIDVVMDKVPTPTKVCDKYFAARFFHGGNL